MEKIMTDPAFPFRYRQPPLDYVENVQKYAPGGYHPVKLYDILDSRYRIVHKLGYGGFATIWLARDLSGAWYVALKILIASASLSELDILTSLKTHGFTDLGFASLQREFSIQGPNGTHRCLVLEFVGPSLKCMLAGRRQLSRNLVRTAARQLAESVERLHSIGICHGDLTNSNILFEHKSIDAWSETELYQHLGQPSTATIVTGSGAIPGPNAPTEVVDAITYSNIDEKDLTGRICIVDFGVSFLTFSPPAGMIGVPAAYFAPEMMFGRPTSAASDAWALGCLIFELRASRPLVLVIFGRLFEALSQVVRTLGPLPKAWQNSFYDQAFENKIRPRADHPWYEREALRPLEGLLREITPTPAEPEICNLLDLLRGALNYDPSQRLSAGEIARHPWLSLDPDSVELC